MLLSDKTMPFCSERGVFLIQGSPASLDHRRGDVDGEKSGIEICKVNEKGKVKAEERDMWAERSVHGIEKSHLVCAIK